MRSTKWLGLSLAAALLLVLGCGGGGGSTPRPVVQAPTALIYSTNPAVYTKGAAIATNTPSNSGGAITTYGVSPALPTGLNLNAATGAITGTPTAISAHSFYVVTGTNAGGTASCNLGLTVNDVAPTGLTYTASTAVYTKGIAITPNNPTSGGGAVVSYSIAPALPTGLGINASTGVISGTPTAIVGTATYTVTATNSGGITTALLSITVNDMVPSNLTYASNPATYTRGSAIAANTPSSSGGVVVSYSVTPTLPAGLAFSTITGVISGTPTVVAASAAYTVTATNSGGFTTASLTLAVNPGAATHFSVTGYPSPISAGIAHPVTVTALDSANFTATGYSGTVHFTSSDPAAVLPGDRFFSASDNGIKSVNCTLKTAGIQSITATDNASVSITGTQTSIEVQAPKGAFLPTGSLVTSRAWHTATLLTNGKVLIAGGVGSGGILPATAELYDLQTGSFLETGALVVNRQLHTATLLPNGKVLIVGGTGGGDARISEIYDPVTGIFTASGPLVVARYSHTATLLSNGKVLIAGGTTSLGTISNAELYDPSTGVFTDTGTMHSGRQGHSATLLANGKVLVSGGFYTNALTSAELYDPNVGTFTTTGSMNAGRYRFTATLLGNGKVLIAGGAGDITFSSADLYDPSTETFTSTGSMEIGRVDHRAVLLPNGQLLVTGGALGTAFHSSSELYDPISSAFTATGDLSSARSAHTMTLLPNNKVLIVGGWLINGALSSSELYDPQDPAPGVFTATGSLANSRAQPSFTTLPNGKILIAGGFVASAGGTTYPTQGELFDPAAGAMSATGSLSTGRDGHIAVRLPNGKVLIAGGLNWPVSLSSAEIFDPATGLFSPTGSMQWGRDHASALRLPNGKVLVAGGSTSGFGYVSSAEIYDPSTGTFSYTGSMVAARADTTMTLLPSGKVLFTGGRTTAPDVCTASAELYDPSTGTFSATSSMASVRVEHTATLLPNGKVMIAGGWVGGGSGAGYLSTIEIYDPATGNFTTSNASLAAVRKGHKAVLLPSGQVLLVGGYNSLLGVYLPVSELYDPKTDGITPSGAMVLPRDQFGATLLWNGRVLIVGGGSALGYSTLSEVYK